MEETKVTEVTEKNATEETTTEIVEKEGLFARVKNAVVGTATKAKDAVIRNRGKIIGAGIAGVAAVGLGMAIKSANDRLEEEGSSLGEVLSDTASDAVDALPIGGESES